MNNRGGTNGVRASFVPALFSGDRAARNSRFVAKQKITRKGDGKQEQSPRLLEQKEYRASCTLRCPQKWMHLTDL